MKSNKFERRARLEAALQKEKQDRIEKNKDLAQKIKDAFPQFTLAELKLMFPEVFR